MRFNCQQWQILMRFSHSFFEKDSKSHDQSFAHSSDLFDQHARDNITMKYLHACYGQHKLETVELEQLDL